MRIERETDQRTAEQHRLGGVRGVGTNAIEAARSRQRVHDEQVARCVEGESLRTPEPGAPRGRLAVRSDAIDRIVGAERGSRDVEMAVRTEGQVKGGDAGRQGREHAGAPLLFDAKDRSRSIADVERAVRPEGETARDAQVARIERGPAVRFDAIHAAVETARYVQPSVASERQRRRVGQVGDERLARPVRPDDEDAYRRLLPARSAEGDVEIAVPIEGGTVDVMDAADERRADLDEHALAG